MINFFNLLILIGFPCSIILDSLENTKCTDDSCRRGFFKFFKKKAKTTEAPTIIEALIPTKEQELMLFPDPGLYDRSPVDRDGCLLFARNIMSIIESSDSGQDRKQISDNDKEKIVSYVLDGNYIIQKSYSSSTYAGAFKELFQKYYGAIIPMEETSKLLELLGKGANVDTAGSSGPFEGPSKPKLPPKPKLSAKGADESTPGTSKVAKLSKNFGGKELKIRTTVSKRMNTNSYSENMLRILKSISSTRLATLVKFIDHIRKLAEDPSISMNLRDFSSELHDMILTPNPEKDVWGTSHKKLANVAEQIFKLPDNILSSLKEYASPK